LLLAVVAFFGDTDFFCAADFFGVAEAFDTEAFFDTTDFTPDELCFVTFDEPRSTALLDFLTEVFLLGVLALAADLDDVLTVLLEDALAFPLEEAVDFEGFALEVLFAVVRALVFKFVPLPGIQCPTQWSKPLESVV